MKTLRNIRIGLFAVVGFIFSIMYLNGVVYAHSSTPSLNAKNFLINTKDKNITKGDLVSFYYKGLPKYHYKTGDNFTKRVGCMEHEYLEVKGLAYYCNKELIAVAQSKDLNYKQLDNFQFKGQIPKGFFFAIGDHKYSYDSRYFGLVSTDSIRGKTIPLW